MGFRFFKRMKIAPGISLNLTKKGASVSLGPRGAKHTIGTRGTRQTFGVPGTGLYYTQSSGSKSNKNVESTQHNENKLDIGFLKRLVTPEHEKNFIDGCKELISGNQAEAFKYLSLVDHPDCQFLCGAFKLSENDFNSSLKYLSSANNKKELLGELFSKYDFYPSLVFNITSHIRCSLTTDIRSLYLLMVEIYQSLNEFDNALILLNSLIDSYPDDLLVKLSLSEILLEYDHEDKLKSLVKLTDDIENESEIHTCLLYYRAIALNKLGLNEIANKTLTNALSKKKDRSEELLKAIRYQRAINYFELGHRARSKKDLESIYAEDPTYEDVSQRLGL